MNKILLLVILAVGCGLTYAADEKKPSPQQEKMAKCNKEAADKKGEARKAFMKECLSAGKMDQREKMTMCNKQAGDKNLKGDERKKFMSECLSK